MILAARAPVGTWAYAPPPARKVGWLLAFENSIHISKLPPPVRVYRTSRWTHNVACRHRPDGPDYAGYRNVRKACVAPSGALVLCFHSRGFSTSSSCLSASASSALIGLLQRGSVLCSARIIAGVTESGAQPWSVSHTRSHCGAAIR